LIHLQSAEQSQTLEELVSLSRHAIPDTARRDAALTSFLTRQPVVENAPSIQLTAWLKVGDAIANPQQRDQALGAIATQYVCLNRFDDTLKITQRIRSL
jgi:hypothetical protein